jgi:drug/metabolite transporter (DMT)-like permease
MSASVLLLILAAAVAHAGWNFAAKRAGTGGAALLWLATWAGVVLYAPLALLLFRPHITPVMLGAIAISACLHLTYFVLLQRGYATGDLSVVYPLARGTGPLLSVIVAVTFLHERPGWLGLTGAAAVIGGIAVITTAGARHAFPRQYGVRAGALYGTGAGILIAAYTIWDAHSVGALALAPIFYDWGNDLCRALMLTPYAVTHRPRVGEIARAHWPEVLMIGALSPLAYILVLYAYTKAPVSVVAPARELSIVIGSLLGWLWLREPQPGRRLTGAAVVVVGIAALAAR